MEGLLLLCLLYVLLLTIRTHVACVRAIQMRIAEVRAI